MNECQMMAVRPLALFALSFLATPSFAAHVREVLELLPACPGNGNFRDGPLKPTGESSPPSLLPLKVLGSRLPLLWAADKRPWRWYWRPTRLPIHRTPRVRPHVAFALPSRHNS